MPYEGIFRNGCIALIILKLATRWRWIVPGHSTSS